MHSASAALSCHRSLPLAARPELGDEKSDKLLVTAYKIQYNGSISLHRKGEIRDMKLIIAIVNKDDSSAVSAALTREGFSVTKMATTGGFLMAGNTTLLMGTDDSRVSTR